MVNVAACKLVFRDASALEQTFANAVPFFFESLSL